MKIKTIRHKGLRKFIEDDDAAGLPAAVIDKVRKIVAFLQDMQNEEELRALQTWKPHQMKGDREGTWSLSVTRNWRITFLTDQEIIEIVDLNYEDYH